MIISLEDIKKVNFSKSSFGGYKAAEVDSFVDRVQILLSELENENLVLRDQVEDLEGKIAEYKKDESSIRAAVLKAQKIADSSAEEADIRSKGVVSDAAKQAHDMICKAQEEVEKERKVLRRLRKSSEEFRAVLTKLYENQLDTVKRSLDGPAKIFPEVFNAKVDSSEIDESKTKFVKHEMAVNQSISHVPSVSQSPGLVRSAVLATGIETSTSTERSLSREQKKGSDDLKFGVRHRILETEYGKKGLYSGILRQK